MNGADLAELEVEVGQRARCREADPEWFFPEKGASTKEAKAVCQVCEVRDGCLELALGRGERFGVWGGMSERERRGLRDADVPRETEE